MLSSLAHGEPLRLEKMIRFLSALAPDAAGLMYRLVSAGAPLLGVPTRFGDPAASLWVGPGDHACRCCGTANLAQPRALGESSEQRVAQCLPQWSQPGQQERQTGCSACQQERTEPAQNLLRAGALTAAASALAHLLAAGYASSAALGSHRHAQDLRLLPDTAAVAMPVEVAAGSRNAGRPLAAYIAFSPQLWSSESFWQRCQLQPLSPPLFLTPQPAPV